MEEAQKEISKKMSESVDTSYRDELCLLRTETRDMREFEVSIERNTNTKCCECGNVSEVGYSWDSEKTPWWSSAWYCMQCAEDHGLVKYVQDWFDYDGPDNTPDGFHYEVVR